ncbi:MAG: glycine-rich domain-containing protein [Sulfuricellaceae bacterium]
MNNGLLGWPGSRKAIQQLVATNGVGNRQFWTSSTTWVVPAGVTRIRASALGGGGSGSAGSSDNSFSGAGGGGGLFLRGWLNVTPGETLTITVGVGGAGTSGAGSAGGSSMILQLGRAVIVASGGNAATDWNAPAPEQAACYFEGTPLVVVPGKGGGKGVSPAAAYAGGGGGGGGGLSAQNTAGSDAAVTSNFGGSGSLGAMTRGGLGAVGVAPPPGTPESGSGGGGRSSGSVGNVGAQGSGGSGGWGYSGSLVPGGRGGAGFVMVEY